LDRLAAMEIFSAVVEGGSFSVAADRLGLSRAATSKQVQELERHLGVRLLNRTTRRVGLTEAGAQFHGECARILAAVHEAEAHAQSQQAEPRGMLKVSAPMSFGILHLGPAVADFMAAHPAVQVNLVLNDRFVDLVEEGFDLAIRIGALVDSSLIVRRIAPSAQMLCAAESYVARHGLPAEPAELAKHNCLTYSHLVTGEEWRFIDSRGASTAVRVAGNLHANNGDVLRAAALCGVGIVMLPSFLVGEDVRAGRLRVLTPRWRPADMAIHAVYPPNPYVPAKLRRFIDFLAERFGPIPPWERAG
jgi:DNA-binding transcriptional LysR family regulator